MELMNKTVLVIGTGVSGVAATKLLVNHKANVVLYDENEKVRMEQVKAKLPRNMPVDIYVGRLPDFVIPGLELAIVSPGVPMDSGLVVRLKDANIPIWGEVELAYAWERGKVVAITGTNGKTTTTALTGEIMKSFYPSVFVVGNIGIPYTGVVERTSGESITVAEVSSFQLETIHTFQPTVSAILNITPDHLDRHHTMEEYVSVKKRIALNQTKEQVCVLNYEDPALREAVLETSAKIMFFSSKRELEDGVYLDGENNVIYKNRKGKTTVCNTRELNILGTHSYENAMAAIAIGVGMGVPIENIRETVTRFQAIEHRIEFVAEVNGVTYYNDSKATNTDSAVKGIQAMTSPTWLIGGGYDKDAKYDEWIESLKGRVKKLVLLGATKEKIADAAKRLGFHEYVMVEDLEEAVAYCRDRAKKGEAVLLSPACASWDMFVNFEERGNRFKDLVRGSSI